MLRLREARKKKNITLKRLGELVGLSESAISQYENGKRQPDNDTLIKFANCLDVSIDYILGCETPTAPQEISPTISEFEQKLLEAYRKQSDLQPAVNKLLGVDAVHILTDDKGGENFVLVEAMLPNKKMQNDLRVAAAPPVTPAQANEEEDEKTIT